MDQAVKDAEQELANARQLWEKRSGLEKTVTDDGLMTPFMVCGLLLIWAVELIFNLRTGITDWVDVSHLLIVGTLEIVLGGFLLFAFLRKWTLARRLARAEKTYRALEGQNTGDATPGERI